MKQENKTFKELNAETKFVKQIKRSGLSYAVIFTKQEMEKFDLHYLDKIDLSEASPIKLHESKS